MDADLSRREAEVALREKAVKPHGNESQFPGVPRAVRADKSLMIKDAEGYLHISARLTRPAPQNDAHEAVARDADAAIGLAISRYNSSKSD